MIKKLKRVILKEEFVKLTGDIVKAIILSQFIYWSERVNDFDTFIAEEKSRAEQSGINVIIEPSNGWIYKTAEQLSEETMLSMAPNSILRHIKELVKNGWLDERNNPDHRWDRTKQYRVNLIKIHKDLFEIGYMLQDYKVDLPFSKIENAFSKMENGSSKTENGSSKTENGSSKIENRTLQNGKAIPEITTEYNNHTSIQHDDVDTRTREEISSVDNVDCVEKSDARTPCEKISELDEAAIAQRIKLLLTDAGFEGSRMEVEFINPFAGVFPFEMIEYAVKKSSLNGIKNLYYIRGILDSWSEKGVKTLDEARKETRYDKKPLSSPKPSGKTNSCQEAINLSDPQAFRDYQNRQSG